MNSASLKQLCHLFGGLLLVVVSYLFYEYELTSQFFLYIALGSLFIIVAALSKWIDQHIGKFSIIFFLVEAIAFYYAAQSKLDQDDSIVNSTILLAAVSYFIMAIYFLLLRNKENKRRHRTKKVPRR